MLRQVQIAVADEASIQYVQLNPAISKASLPILCTVQPLHEPLSAWVKHEVETGHRVHDAMARQNPRAQYIPQNTLQILPSSVLLIPCYECFIFVDGLCLELSVFFYCGELHSELLEKLRDMSSYWHPYFCPNFKSLALMLLYKALLGDFVCMEFRA